MINKYIVAGHLFSVEMPEECRVWKELTNYEPFKTGSDVSEKLFSLSVNTTSPWDGSRTEDIEPVYVVELDPEEPRLDLYRRPDGFWWVEMAPLGRMKPVAVLEMDPDFSNGRLSLRDLRYGRFAIDNSTMLMFAFCSAPYKTIEMHSSVTMLDGKAYMFLARSGTGKSTHSQMWLNNIKGAELLNDDNPVVRIQDDGSIRVFGTPWSGKTPCYRNQSAELGAMVRIRRCPENRITRLNIPEAYASVNSSTSGFRPVTAMADGLHETISTIALEAPCFVLDCRPDADAAFTCYEGVCRK